MMGWAGRWTLLVAAFVVVLTSIVEGLAQPDSDGEQTTFLVELAETVLVFVRADNRGRVIVGAPLLGEGERFVHLGRFIIQVNAITDYELRLSGRLEHLEPPPAQEIFIDPLPLEAKLDEESLQGSPVRLNYEATRFLPVRRIPYSYRLFQGGNNVVDPTRCAIEVRLDLRRLPSGRSGERLRFQILLTVIEQ